MSADDTIPGPKSRPNDPNFWKLSSILLQLDGRIQEAADEAEKNAAWDEAVESAGIAPDTLAYVSMQRAFRLVGAYDAESILRQNDTITKLTVAYMEGFIIGSKYQQDI